MLVCEACGRSFEAGADGLGLEAGERCPACGGVLASSLRRRFSHSAGPASPVVPDEPGELQRMLEERLTGFAG